MEEEFDRHFRDRISELLPGVSVRLKPIGDRDTLVYGIGYQKKYYDFAIAKIKIKHVFDVSELAKVSAKRVVEKFINASAVNG